MIVYTTVLNSLEAMWAVSVSGPRLFGVASRVERHLRTPRVSSLTNIDCDSAQLKSPHLCGLLQSILSN